MLFCDAPQRPAGITGVNVVAVERNTGVPLVARLSGAEAGSGRFEVVGLPAGTYELRFLDGSSFAGIFPGLFQPRSQRDNFVPFTLGPWTVGAGQVEDLGDVPIPIEPMSIDQIAVGPDRQVNSGIDPALQELPAATKGESYHVWLHLRGGTRPIMLVAKSGLPAGLTATMVTGGILTQGDHGAHWIEIVGTPTDSGPFVVSLGLRDVHATPKTMSFGLNVQP